MDTALRDFLISDRKEEIPTSIAAKILNVNRRTVQRLCDNGMFASARKKTMGLTSGWLVSRAEVIRYKINTHAQPYC